MAAITNHRIPTIRVRAPLIQATAAGDATRHTITAVANVAVAQTKAVEQTSIARASATTRAGTATSATTVLQTARQGSIDAAAAVRAAATAKAARTSRTTPPIRVRAPLIQTTVDGDATRHTITAVANVALAQTKAAVRISTARVSVTIRAATATSATIARPIVPQASIVAAAAARVQDRARIARTSLRTQHTRVRAQSIQTIVPGDACPPTITAAASATAVRTRIVVLISTARALAVIRVGIAIDATTARRIVPRANTAGAAAARAQDHALGAQTSHRTQHTRVKAESMRTIVAGSATPHTTTVVVSAIAAPTSHAAETSIARVRATTRVAMATSATAARLTVPQVNIAPTAAVRALAHAKAARVHPRMRVTRIKALLTRTIAAGCALMGRFTIPMVSASAVRISHAVQISIARDHVVT